MSELEEAIRDVRMIADKGPDYRVIKACIDAAVNNDKQGETPGEPALHIAEKHIQNYLGLAVSIACEVARMKRGAAGDVNGLLCKREGYHSEEAWMGALINGRVRISFHERAKYLLRSS